MAEITYYFKNEEVVAMSYLSGTNYVFCEGSLFKDRCPALMGNGFTANRITHCETQASLTKRIKELEKRLTTILHPDPLVKRSVTNNIYSDEYKEFRAKYGK